MTEHNYEVGGQVQIANGDWFEIVEANYKIITLKNEELLLHDNELITNYRPPEKLFDLNEAIPGMCFLDGYGKKWWFMCIDWHDNNYGWFASDECNDPFNIKYNGLTRYPEGDHPSVKERLNNV